jgi:IS30 family transposase
MLTVKTIRKIRCAYERDKKSIREIARDFNLARNTVKKMLRQGVIDQQYVRKEQPLPKLGPYQVFLSERLSADSTKPKREQRTARVLFEEVQRQGYAASQNVSGARTVTDRLAFTATAFRVS